MGARVVVVVVVVVTVMVFLMTVPVEEEDEEEGEAGEAADDTGDLWMRCSLQYGLSCILEFEQLLNAQRITTVVDSAGRATGRSCGRATDDDS